MPNFAVIKNDIVVNCIVAESKTIAEQISNLLCIEYNENIKNFPNIGYTYDSNRNAFIAPKPFNSWVLDEATCQWQAPTPMPTDGKDYYWSEDDLTWRESVNGND